MDKAIHVIFSYSFRNALGSLNVNILEGEVPIVFVNVYFSVCQAREHKLCGVVAADEIVDYIRMSYRFLKGWRIP